MSLIGADCSAERSPPLAGRWPSLSLAERGKHETDSYERLASHCFARVMAEGSRIAHTLDASAGSFRRRAVQVSATGDVSFEGTRDNLNTGTASHARSTDALLYDCTPRYTDPRCLRSSKQRSDQGGRSGPIRRARTGQGGGGTGSRCGRLCRATGRTEPSPSAARLRGTEHDHPQRQRDGRGEETRRRRAGVATPRSKVRGLRHEHIADRVGKIRRPRQRSSSRFQPHASIRPWRAWSR